ncbi:MAG TPA: BTAD domain-containing putative transcriptional regulator [Ilumatobacteraceae bacterium]|nr:BTAD domain-containing putative transcriptional regulator [Ilumatobacteraceae bacterium]
MLSISVLGPVEVRRSGEPLTVPRGKTSELLVRLALDAGVFVRTDRLVDELWAADAVHTSRNTLQSKIAKLRRALGEPSVVISGDDGYMLVVDPPDVDAFAVLRHAAAAATSFETGDDRGAADLCASALKLYRGDVLAGAGAGEWVTPHRARLEEARMMLVEIELSARLRLGDVGDVIGELEAAVATYPFRERLWVLLITALYRSGRQADALAAFQRVRNVLAEELGLEPGPQLRHVEQQILVHDASLDAAGPTASALGRDATAGNLPSISAELVGRKAELAAIAELLENKRLVVIVGPGGVGKTALAIATAASLTAADGVWLARLDTATTANDVTDTVIATLNVTGGEAALNERVRGTDTLVILDNCEHVIDAAADVAVRLLDASPGVRVLCTSQVALDVDGEAVFELAPLDLEDAVELFTRRATAQRKNLHIDDAHEAVHDLCRALDGLPLAIELAAARSKTLSIEEIARRLDDRFNVLSDPTSRRPERRRALKATIRWSYELLFPDDQRGLWALATFAGGAPLGAVDSVLEALDVPAVAAIDVVGRLAGRSLVIVDDDGGSTGVRYRLLDSIRAFALEAMADAHLIDAGLAAHARWFADAAGSSTTGVRSSRQAEHLSFARAERANIDAALAWCVKNDPPLALTIVNGFGWAWVVLGDTRAVERITAALDAAGDTAPAGDRAAALLIAAWLEASTGDLERARHHIAVATELAESIGDLDLQARCSYYLAYVVSHDGEFEQAISLTDRSRALYVGLDRAWDLAAGWLFTARAAISASDHDRSVEACDAVDQALRTVDDPWLHVRRDAIFGELARMQHRFDDAIRHIARAAATSGRLGFLQTEAYQLFSLGRAQCQAGDYEAGRAAVQIAIDKAEATGDVRMAALARVHLGRIRRALGEWTGARSVLETATAWHRVAGGGEQALLGECLLAAMDAADEVPGAHERLAAILAEARHSGEAHVEVLALDALARDAARMGDVDTARAMCETADARMDAALHFITDLDRTDAYAIRQALAQ